MAVASAGPYASLHLAPDITMPVPHHSVFYRPDALPVAQPTASKHGRQVYLHVLVHKKTYQKLVFIFVPVLPFNVCFTGLQLLQVV